MVLSVPILPIGEVSTQYYFRLFVLDKPGVLSTISGILGNNGISIKSVQQKSRKADEAVPIVMLTHTAKESSMNKAVSEIRKLDVVSGEPLMIRIEDENDNG